MPRKAKEQKHKGVFERDKGTGIWWVRYVDVDGKRKARSIGTFGDAVNFYEGEKARIRKHIIAPPSTHRGVRYNTLVDDAIENNETSHRDKRNFKQRMEVTREKFGNRVAESITPNELQDWLEEMVEECDWSNATFNRYRAAMSKAFKIGIQNRKVTNNPARLVPQKSEAAGRLRYLTDEEEVRLRQALVKRPWAVGQLDIALHTGMRKSEQFSVTLDQIDFGQKHIHLTMTKNGSSRYVHLNSEALRVLAQCKKSGSLWMSRQRKPMADPREWFANACKEAKIEGVTWHTLRHTFASRLVMAGVDLKTLQDLMGHKTLAMTARYSHLSPEHKLKALETLVPVRA